MGAGDKGLANIIPGELAPEPGPVRVGRTPAGLPAREPRGVPVFDLSPGGLSLSFLAPAVVESLISPPEPAPRSPSLPDPDPAGPFRPRFLLAWSPAAPGLRWPEGPGDMGRDSGWASACLLLGFLREVSVPLASERLGEPARFRAARDVAFLLSGSVCLGRPEGVFVPFVDAPEFLSDSLPFSFFTCSSSSFSCSSFRRSVSESSELYVWRLSIRYALPNKTCTGRYKYTYLIRIWIRI